jgi:26S proteasome regulatory subunit N1
MLDTAMRIFRNQKKYYDALRVALRIGSNEDTVIPELFEEASDDLPLQKQMGLLLAKHRHSYGFDLPDADDSLLEVIGNVHLSEQYLKVAQDLDVMDVKTPEDIYKSHLAETGGFTRRRDNGAAHVDSARANLASTFVNAFVNAGFCQDKVRNRKEDKDVHQYLLLML